MIRKKNYIDDAKPILLGLIKVLPRPISKTHGIAVISIMDIQVSPLFFTMFVLIYHIKDLMKKYYFYFGNSNTVFKQGLIQPGVIH
jgi:hypothetical protein